MNTQGLREKLLIMNEPNVKPLAASTFLNAAGNNVYVVVLSWLAYDITDSPLAVGVVVGLRFVPIMIMGIISGTITDRMYRPTVLRLYAIWYTILSFGFTGLLYWGTVSLTHILLYMFLLGLAFTFGPNARRAIYGDSVTRSRVVSALALDGAAFSLGHVMMPAIVGFLLSVYGPTTTFIVQCTLYAGMTLLAFRVKLPYTSTTTPKSSSFRKDIVAGIRYARNQVGVRRVLLISSLLALLGDNFMFALVPIVSKDTFDAGAAGIGIIVTGGAIGGLVGPVLLIAVKGSMGSLRTFVVSSGIKALGMLLFAFSPSLGLAVFAYGVLSATSPSQKAILDGYLQLAVPSEYRGRIGSLNQMARGIAALAAFLAGVLAQLFGVWVAIVAAAVVVVFIGIWAMLGLRHYQVEGW